MATHSATVELDGDRGILITREFDAPPHLVFEALTTPEHVRRWWGAQRGQVTECEIDLRVGGAWRYVMAAGDMEVGFHGEYEEIVPGARLVCTEIYEGAPDAPSRVTTMLTELEGGRTRMVVSAEHHDGASRDAVIASGMEAGMQDSYDALERVAVELAG